MYCAAVACGPIPLVRCENHYYSFRCECVGVGIFGGAACLSNARMYPCICVTAISTLSAECGCVRANAIFAQENDENENN